MYCSKLRLEWEGNLPDYFPPFFPNSDIPIKKRKKKPLTLSSIKSWLLPHCCAGHPRQAFWPATGPLLLPASVPAVDLEP